MDINLDLTAVKDKILPAFYPLLKDKKRFQIIYGGAGSGKSVYVTQNYLMRVLVGMSKGYRHTILCIRQTAASIRESVYSEFKNTITEWNIPRDIVTPNKSNLSFDFIDGSKIISAGLDDVEKLKSISGITSIWIEEGSQISLESFKQINLRLRSKIPTKQQIIITFNPISRTNWLHDRFFLTDKDDVTIHHSTWRDNLYLTDVYKKQLQDLEDEDINYYRIYNLGEWGELKGVIYSNWKITDKEPQNYKEVIWGVDFGFNDPTVLLKVGLYDNEYYIDEHLYKSGLTNRDFIEILKKVIPVKDRRKQIIYADNAEPARIEEICREGFICKPADKSVKDGIDFCRRIKMNITSKSQNVLKEIQGYKWKEDKDGRLVDDPVKFRDHTCDSFRYALYTHYGKIRPKASISFA